MLFESIVNEEFCFHKQNFVQKHHSKIITQTNQTDIIQLSSIDIPRQSYSTIYAIQSKKIANKMSKVLAIRNVFRQWTGSSAATAAAATASTATNKAASATAVGSVDLLKQSNDIWTILLNNPSKRNALTGKMMAEFADAVDEIERLNKVSYQSLKHQQLVEDDAKSISPSVAILRGAGSFFCSGADLSLAKEHLDTKEKGYDMSLLMQDTTSRLRNLGQVSIATIEKGCYGGGTELALSCDHIIMEESAQFKMVQVSVKVSPGWGGANRLVKKIGRSKALRILTTAPSLSASECLALGIVDKVFPNGQAEKAIEEFTKPVIMHDKAALRACKLSVAAADDFPTNEALEMEARAFRTVWASSANKERISNIMKSLKG